MTNEILDQTSPPVATDEKEQRRARWLLWLQWVLVSAVGWAFAAWANEHLVIGLGVVCIALGQWLVLRPRLARAGWWMLVTSVGLGLGHFVALFYIYLAGWGMGWPDVSLGLLGMLLVGTPVGFLQGLVLRRVRRALWWVPVTVVAIGASYVVLWLCLMAFAQRPVHWFALVDGTVGTAGLATALGGFVGGAVYGAITGAALVVLLPHPGQTQDRKPSWGGMTIQGGKLEEQGSKTKLERVLAALAHGSILLWVPTIFGGIFGGLSFVGIGIGVALCIWLVMKGKSAYARGQALQAVVYQVGVVVITVVGIIGIGVAGPDWAEATLYAFDEVFPVLAILYALWGAVRCLDGHDFRYAIVGKLVGKWI